VTHPSASTELCLVESDAKCPLLGFGIRDAAKSVGVSEKHFRDELLPLIPHLRVGRRVIIPVDGFRDWLRERSTGL